MNTETLQAEHLIALALGDLDSSQAAELEARIARTPEARRLLDQIRALVAALSTDDGVSPPDELVRKVKGLMGAASSAAAPVARERATLREVIATLVFDSFGKVAVPGFRGTIATRQLAYSSADADVDLRVTSPDDSRRSILGQVAPAHAAEIFEVVVTRPGDTAPLASTTVDARGMFTLESPPGVFDLRVRVGDAIVTLPMLNIE